MNKAKSLFLFFILISALLAATGCVKIKNTKDTSSIDGGVFKSSDRGQTWKQKISIPTISGKPGNFAGVNAASMAIDPNDNQAIYFGSVGSGLLYSYDGGNSWQTAKGLANMTIRSVTVDPKSKCVIYASAANKVYKSTDCSRSWSKIYFDNNLTATVDALAIDHFDSSKVYIAVSRGDIIKSSDNGESWQTIYRINKKVNKIVINPFDSRNIYVLTSNKGIFYSHDSGDSWKDLNSVLKEFELKFAAKDLKFALGGEDKLIFLATTYGMLKSKDNGATWEKIELIPSEKNAAINAMAINPKNSQEIYYVTNTTFYRSIDGGQNWTPSKLPTTRAGWQLLIDPQQPNTIYMGVKRVAK
ncbi:MAG: YCF48-related protein [Patescibacteria group bacterium]|nr:YCF48-related protein [Patescibacteria group bacterium]